MSNRHYISPIFVPHKGCPHDCIFCNQKKITGQVKEVAAADVGDTIEAYLKTIPDTAATVEVAFYGGSFTAVPLVTQQALLGAAYPYVLNRRVHAIRLSTRPDCITPEILDNLKRYGVGIVELGVQSMDDTVLRLSNRGHSAGDVIHAADLLGKYGFTVGVQVMIGLPGDTREKSVDTVRRLIALKPQIARIYPALVIRNTHLEKLYLAGEYQPLPLEEAVETSKALLTAFEKHHVKVIRIGLQPTENILPGRDVVAGPFHPAMRQLVESRIYRDMLEYMLAQCPQPVKAATVTASPGCLSDVIGQKKGNLSYLSKKFFIDTLKVCPDNDAEAGRIMLNADEKCISLSRKDYCYSVTK